MQLETLTYRADQGWSVPLPDLDSDRTLVLVFGSPAIGSAPFDELRQAFGRSALLGCSTSGEIFDDRVQDDSLSVAVLRFEDTEVRAATTAVTAPEASFEAGRTLAAELAGDGLRAVLVLSDGLNVNGSDLVSGLNAVLDESVVVTGGLAGDGDRFETTWVLDGEGPRSGVISAVGLYGDRVQVGHGSKGGWDMFGPERTVTRSKDNVLFELDGKPALQLYKEYLGERASGLPATALLFPLALSHPEEQDGKMLVRTVLAVDEQAQSMTFAGNVPEGHRAQLMRANFERLIGGASEAALRSCGQDADEPLDTLSIAISCVGRRLILGERTEEEVEAALDELPDGTRQVGFYSYGEISPYASGQCDLHNQTMTLTTIRELPPAASGRVPGQGDADELAA